MIFKSSIFKYLFTPLLTNRFNGSNAVKGERIALDLQILKKLASEFKYFSLGQVPREENVEADALANRRSSLRMLPEVRIPIIPILIPIIEDPSNKLDDPNHHDQTTKWQ